MLQDSLNQLGLSSDLEGLKMNVTRERALLSEIRAARRPSDELHSVSWMIFAQMYTDVIYDHHE